MITIPDSVRFYWSDPANMAAVNVLADIEDIPGDLTLQEAERFALANLAACRVRVEFWRLLRQLWAATWNEAVMAAFPTARLLTYGEHEAWSDDESPATPSLEYAWEDRATTGLFELPGGETLFTYLGFAHSDREIQLKFYVYDRDESNATSDGLDLGTDWTDDGDSQRVTQPGLITLLRGDLTIDLERLVVLASGAVAALAAAIR